VTVPNSSGFPLLLCAGQPEVNQKNSKFIL
jgi:hypothetical protein